MLAITLANRLKKIYDEYRGLHIVTWGPNFLSVTALHFDADAKFVRTASFCMHHA